MASDEQIAAIRERVEAARSDGEYAYGKEAQGHVAYLLDCLEAVERERDRLLEREQHWAQVLGVADGGQYRNDWDARIRGVVTDRDKAVELLRELHTAWEEVTVLPIPGVTIRDLPAIHADTFLSDYDTRAHHPEGRVNPQ